MSKKAARILITPVVSKVEGIDNDLATKMAVSASMSYKVEGFEHMTGVGNWDGTSSLFDWQSSKFPSGFVPTVISVLVNAGYEPQIIKKPLPAPLGPLPTPDNPIIDNFAADPNRAYQFKCISILEKHGSYIARIATGGGKSRIAALCVKRIGRKTMFITTRTVLLYQMGKALTEAGIKVSYVGDSQWDTSGDVVLGMVQTIADRLRELTIDVMGKSAAEVQAARAAHEHKYRQALDLAHSIEFVIGEEAHEAGGEGYYTVLKHCKNAYYRLALTATPLMRSGESNARLVGMFGPVRIEVSEKQLIDAGILATPKFKFVEIPPPPMLRRGSSWMKAEEVGIVTNLARNKHICAEVIRASRFDLGSLVLVKRKNHGKILHAMLQKVGLRGTFIFGESSKDTREAALKQLGKGQIDYIIGSTILDVGVDVPSIGLLVLAGGGKVEVGTRQRIGRALRGKKNMPNFAFIVDFTDPLNKHLIAHARQRRAIVDQTPGFAENVLKKGQDFDFVGLGFRRAMAA